MYLVIIPRGEMKTRTSGWIKPCSAFLYLIPTASESLLILSLSPVRNRQAVFRKRTVYRPDVISLLRPRLLRLLSVVEAHRYHPVVITRRELEVAERFCETSEHLRADVGAVVIDKHKDCWSVDKLLKDDILPLFVPKDQIERHYAARFFIQAGFRIAVLDSPDIPGQKKVSAGERWITFFSVLTPSRLNKEEQNHITQILSGFQ